MAFCFMVHRSNIHVTPCMGTVSTSTHYTLNISVYKRHTSVTTAVGFMKTVSHVISQQEHEISNCPSGELFVFACHYFGPMF